MPTSANPGRQVEDAEVYLSSSANPVLTTLLKPPLILRELEALLKNIIALASFSKLFKYHLGQIGYVRSYGSDVAVWLVN